ncbi:MAG: flavodoxin family protein, partial [Dehalococcoidia bacterium]
MKVTVLNGSPRGRKSNSHIMIEPLLEGARQAGAETEEVFLVEKDIKHCRGCFACWVKTPGICTIKDGTTGLLDLLLESDYAGMATPVY